MEWIVLDDGTDKVGDLFADLGLPNVRYIAAPERMTIGAKRNRLNQEATGDYIVCMDDDDYYPPDRVAHAVQRLQQSKRQVAGCSELHVFFTDTGSIVRFGPYAHYGPNHAINNTMAYTRAYARAHVHPEDIRCGEEAGFLEGYSTPMVQLDPFKTILAISHESNTVDKRGKRADPLCHTTALHLRAFIKDRSTRNLFGFVTKAACL
jgi:glycosyltransferase involved in cell wall biosynthesis